MREQDFRVVLAEWKARELPELIEREVKIPLNEDIIIALIGPRQAGKTFRTFQAIKELLRKIPKDNLLYVNFEHDRLKNLIAKDLDDMLKVYYQLFSPSQKHKIFLFLDEIQNVADWDRWLRKILDTGKYKIFVTGSSSKLSSKEIATQLRGRSVDFTIFPFSFKEFLKAKNFKIKDKEVLSYLVERGKILALLEEYLTLGAYPKIVLTKNKEMKKKLLKTYYETIFYKDLVERYEFPSIELDLFLRYCINNYSKYISISKAHNYLKSLHVKIGKKKLIEFLKASNEVFFLFPSKIFSYSMKNEEQYPKKIYVVDNGIINVLNEKTEVGRLMENLVAIQLTRQGISFGYWKEYGKQEGKEVDFVIKQGMEVKQLIQVTYASNRDEIEKREIKALLKASELLKCKNLLVITWDYEAEEKVKNKRIKFVPLWKWLLK